MRLEWSVLALNDRNDIFDYIEVDSLQAAISVDERIEEQVEQLVEFPEMGRPGRIEETRELVIQQTPYIVAYQVIGETVRLLRVLHGALQWPEEMPDEKE